MCFGDRIGSRLRPLAAKRFGQKAHEWLRLRGRVSYLAAFKRKYGNIPHLQTRRGVGGRTWLHPKPAVAFGRWLSDKFGVWCDLQIDGIIRNAILPSHLTMPSKASNRRPTQVPPGKTLPETDRGSNRIKQLDREILQQWVVRDGLRSRHDVLQLLRAVHHIEQGQHRLFYGVPLKQADHPHGRRSLRIVMRMGLVSLTSHCFIH
jgi:hypothetical protein